jgi:hypothetical protein
MADITLNYRGLTGKRGTVTVDDTGNILSIITAIVADEDPTLGVLTGNDYNIALERDKSITDVANGSDTISTHIVNGDTIICIDDKKNILPNGETEWHGGVSNGTNTKEVRQNRKLRIASVKREWDSSRDVGEQSVPHLRAHDRYTFDATQLPDTYNGNDGGTTLDYTQVDDNPNLNGKGVVELVVGRPWV